MWHIKQLSVLRENQQEINGKQQQPVLKQPFIQDNASDPVPEKNSLTHSPFLLVLYNIFN